MSKSIDGPDRKLLQLFRRRSRSPHQQTRAPLRAALLTPGLAMGGAERWLVSLVRYTDPELVRWTGVAISSLGGTDESLCQELMRHTTLHCQKPNPKLRNPDRPFHESCFGSNVHPEWTDAVREACARADVVVAWGGIQSVGNWVRDLDIPSIVVSHTTEREAELFPIEDVTHLAAVSNAAAAYFDDRAGRGQYDDVKVVFNGADQARCMPAKGRVAQREQWGVSEDDVAVGYVGRESPEKNFLAAANGVLAMEPRFRAVYHSSLVQMPGEHDATLISLAADHPGKILLNPTQPMVGDILAGLDALVLASHREAFSLALAEAWLAKVPVVATPVGSLPELQEQFGIPLAIEVPMDPSPADVSRALRRAVGPEGREIAERACGIAREHFTCEAMAQNWSDYLKEVVGEHSHRLAREESLGSRLAAWIRQLRAQPAQAD